MKFENTEVWGFKHALRGMRNPKNSWHKSDSVFTYYTTDTNIIAKDKENDPNNYGVGINLICLNDMQLAQNLIRGGSEHRKFMRQIFVSVDITASLFFFKEFDTYKVGTVANSTSTMHKLASTPITLDCFEIDDYRDDLSWIGTSNGDCVSCYDKNSILAMIDMLEGLRLKYLETNDKKYWKELIRWLPESWLQKRTITLNYENLLAKCSKGQRRFHKLNEWSGIDNPNVPNFIAWARSLPYAQQLIFIDELDEVNDK